MAKKGLFSKAFFKGFDKTFAKKTKTPKHTKLSSDAFFRDFDKKFK